MNPTPLGDRETVGRLDGGTIRSDGGEMLWREVELRTGIIRQCSTCFADHRDAESAEQIAEELLAQRIFAPALGSADLLAHDDLRHAPLAARVSKWSTSGQRSETMSVPLGWDNEPCCCQWGLVISNRKEHAMVNVGMDVHWDKTVCHFLDPQAEPNRRHRHATVPTAKTSLGASC